MPESTIGSIINLRLCLSCYLWRTLLGLSRAIRLESIAAGTPQYMATCKNHFANFIWAATIGQRTSQMQPQFMGAIESRNHAYV